MITLKNQPDLRPSIDKILEHPFLAGGELDVNNPDFVYNKKEEVKVINNELIDIVDGTKNEVKAEVVKQANVDVTNKLPLNKKSNKKLNLPSSRRLLKKKNFKGNSKIFLKKKLKTTS